MYLLWYGELFMLEELVVFWLEEWKYCVLVDNVKVVIDLVLLDVYLMDEVCIVVSLIGVFDFGVGGLVFDVGGSLE